MTSISPPDISELLEYYRSYWKYLDEQDMLQGLESQTATANIFLESITEDKANSSYADGKWILKEVVGHLSDTERILSYRALSFARKESTPLSAFDENAYILNSNFKSRSLKDILQEWGTVRAATLSLFRSMDEEMLDRKGIANNITLTPRIVMYFILVHERHHLAIIKERYLNVMN